MFVRAHEIRSILRIEYPFQSIESHLIVRARKLVVRYVVQQPFDIVRRRKEQCKFSLFFEVVVNAYPLPLLWEILLILAFAALTGLITASELNPEYSGARRFFTSILAALVVGLLLLTVWHFYQRPEEVFSISGLKDFCLPIYFTFVVLPYAYLVAVYAGYEALFSTRLARHAMMPAEVRSYAKRRLISTCHLNVNHTRRARAFLAPEFRWADTRVKVDDEINRLREELAWSKPPEESQEIDG